MSATRMVVVFAIAVLLSAGTCPAHGGQYRGNGDSNARPDSNGQGGSGLPPGLVRGPTPKLGPSTLGPNGPTGPGGPSGPSGPSTPTSSRNGANNGNGVARAPGGGPGPDPGSGGRSPTTPGPGAASPGAGPAHGGPGSDGGPRTGTGAGGAARPPRGPGLPAPIPGNSGPGDVVGPATPGRGPGAARPPSPIAGGGSPSPRPGGPVTGSRAPAAVGVAATTPRGGIPLEAFLQPDGTSWLHWWEFNKDPFIRLKDAVHTGHVETGSDEFFMGVGRRRVGAALAPSEAQIVGQVLPALKSVMDHTGQRDIISSVLVALAKGGRDHPDFEILPLMAERLTSGDQEIRETAALAMGISQMPEAVDRYLLDLVQDGPAGRMLVGRGEVDYRTRSFAAYGLGLVAWATQNGYLRIRVFDALNGILEDDRIVSRDVRIAAINSMGLLAPRGNGVAEKSLFASCLKALETYYLKSLGAGEQLVQAHVPPAIAKLVRSGPLETVRHYRELFLSELQGRGPVRRSSNDISRSLVLALGELCTPGVPGIGEALLDVYGNESDKQTRYFCLIALARIGGEANRDALLRELDRGQRATEKPWAGLALGVYEHDRIAQARLRGLDPQVDPMVGEALHRELLLNKNPETLAGLAIALGLCGYLEAADDIRDLLERYRYRDVLAGYLCVSLALMDDQTSKGLIQDIVASSVRRPELLRQAAVALGKLGDKSVTEVLQSMLVEGGQNLAKMSAVASALGFIGDRRTVGPLLEMLSDESLAALSRAFAAVALGGVIDKESLPWNSKIGVNMNYRAMVETLTDGAAGILDIL